MIQKSTPRFAYAIGTWLVEQKRVQFLSERVSAPSSLPASASTCLRLTELALAGHHDNECQLPVLFYVILWSVVVAYVVSNRLWSHCHDRHGRISQHAYTQWTHVDVQVSAHNTQWSDQQRCFNRFLHAYNSSFC